MFSTEKILREIGASQEPKTVFVNGFGRIGESVANACRGRGYDVVVFDIDIERRLQAIASGYWSCPRFTGHSGGCGLSCDELAW